MATSLFWFRQDLRLADNPGLLAALQRGAVVPLYVDSPEEDGAWRDGAAARWWLRANLGALAADLARLGAPPLRLERGAALATIRRVCADTGADAVFWNRRYEPAAMARDRAVKTALRADGLVVESRNGALLLEPWEIANQSGRPFLVFTPFWKELLKRVQPPLPTSAPATWPAGGRAAPARTGFPDGAPPSLDDLFPLPRPAWHRAIEAAWPAGESAAQQQLEHFSAGPLAAYRDARDRPAMAGTSRLSPYLHVGAISPRQVWHAIGAALSARAQPAAEWRAGKFLAELVWREFAHHLLFHHPQLPDEPLRREFTSFPWREDARALAAWQRGRTGIPLVDAGMRELWATGWMHNRVRMVVASFLVKNLRLHWQHGARWFWDTLIDADLANNTQGWQWTAGCGADAAPYFRVFNPVTQALKFDPDAEYIRRWVPELAALDTPFVHEPWRAPRAPDYPPPIVDLAASRTAALAAFRTLRGPTSASAP